VDECMCYKEQVMFVVYIDNDILVYLKKELIQTELEILQSVFEVLTVHLVIM
jgi:hypothetical protein